MGRPTRERAAQMRAEVLAFLAERGGRARMEDIRRFRGGGKCNSNHEFIERMAVEGLVRLGEMDDPSNPHAYVLEVCLPGHWDETLRPRERNTVLNQWRMTYRRVSHGAPSRRKPRQETAAGAQVVKRAAVVNEFLLPIGQYIRSVFDLGAVV